MSDAERDLPASPLRRAWAREQGFAPRSAAAVSASVLAAAAGWAWLQAGQMLQTCASLIEERLSLAAGASLSARQAAELLQHDVLFAATAIGWLLLTAWASALIVQWLHQGFAWNPQAAAPDASRLGLQAALQRVSTGETTATAIGQIVGAIVLGAAAAVLIGRLGPGQATAAAGPVDRLAEATLQQAAGSGLQLAVVALLLSGVDLVWRRWRFEQALAMSPDQLRDEQAGQSRKSATRR